MVPEHRIHNPIQTILNISYIDENIFLALSEKSVILFEINSEKEMILVGSSIELESEFANLTLIGNFTFIINNTKSMKLFSYIDYELRLMGQFQLEISSIHSLSNNKWFMIYHRNDDKYSIIFFEGFLMSKELILPFIPFKVISTSNNDILMIDANDRLYSVYLNSEINKVTKQNLTKIYENAKIEENKKRTPAILEEITSTKINLDTLLCYESHMIPELSYLADRLISQNLTEFIN